MSNKIYIRSANNSWGEKMTGCYAGEFNITLEDNELKLNIYYRNKRILQMPCYKTPYHIAVGVLSAGDPVAVAELIKEYLDEGLIAGQDFTVTKNGVHLLTREHFDDYDESYYAFHGLKKPKRRNWQK